MSDFLIQRADGTRRKVGGYKSKAPDDAKQFEPSLGLEELPPSVDLRPHLTPVEDQGETNSCVANATAGAFEYLIKQHTGSNYDVSRMFIYYNARKLEDDDIEDEGTAIHDAVDSLKRFGVCAEKTWPFDENRVNAKPHANAYDEADEAMVDQLEQVPTELDAWRHCLAEGRPIIFGVALYDSFDKARKGKVPMPTDRETTRGKHGRHAMLCVGYSDTDELFIVRNSWGSKWGDNGYCYIPYEYLMNGDYNSDDSWVIRHVNGVGEPDRSTWGDDASILPDLDQAELHRMSDAEYQVMLEAFGDVPVESRLALLYLVAAGSDGKLTQQELMALGKEVQRMHVALGSELSAVAVLDFAGQHVGDGNLVEESIVLLGSHLTRGLLATILKSMRSIAGADGLGEDESSFLDAVTAAWEIGGRDESADSEEEDDEEEDSDSDEEGSSGGSSEFIQRAPEDRGDLFAWWDGSELTAQTQFMCDVNEIILVLDAETEELVAELNAGRSSLPPSLGRYLSGGEVLVIFLTITPVTLETEGALEDVDDEPWCEVVTKVTVRDTEKALELLPQLGEDESPEEWIEAELLIALARAAQEHGGDLEALQSVAPKLAMDAEADLNETLAEYGMQVSTPLVSLSESED
jgi:hypothetical protein